MSTEFSPSSRPAGAPQPTVPEYTLGQALAWLLDPSKAIRRTSWSPDAFIYLAPDDKDEQFVMVLQGDREMRFAIHERDIRGTDWIVVQKPEAVWPSNQSSATDLAEPQ